MQLLKIYQILDVHNMKAISNIRVRHIAESQALTVKNENNCILQISDKNVWRPDRKLKPCDSREAFWVLSWKQNVPSPGTIRDN